MSSQVIIAGFDPEGPFAGLFLPARFRQRCRETRFSQEWRLTFPQYLAMMAGWPRMSKRKQRGSIMLAAFGATPEPIVVLNNHGFFASVAATVTSGVLFENDGGLTEIDSNSGNTAQAGEWYRTEPQTNIGSGYEVRATSSSSTWTAAAAIDDAWITMNINRQWSNTQSSPGFKLTTATFEIGLDGVESALDSASITCNADFVI